MEPNEETLERLQRRPPSRDRVAWIGLGAGPVLALVVYALLPEEFAGSDGAIVELGHAGRATAAVGVLMATWWMTEAIEISATALLPIALFPLVQAMSIDEAAAPYANPLIFLFLGGFLLALSMQRWGLERRIALIALRLVGTEPRRVVGGFMVITAVFSMWVSNTATVAMMLPVALSVIDAAVPGGRHALLATEPRPGRNFARSLLLGIAVSASIGGVGTLIGTPPNLFLASFARENLGIDISFVAWLGIGVPIVVVFLPIGWVLLTRVLFPPDIEPEALTDVLSDEARDELGSMKAGEWATFVVFSLTALAWVFRPLLEDLTIAGGQPLSGLSDAGIALVAGVVLFMIPVDRRRREFVMDWDTARGVPWGILILFGGGLSLANAVDVNGVADYLGAQAEVLDALPAIAIVVAITAGVVFLTELTSNTATAAALIPIFAAIAPALGIEPLGLAIPTAIAASLAFMLPVATPPNAIVFGSGFVQIPDMMRMGLRLNVAAVVIVTAATYLLAGPVLGIDLGLG
jgi:solute carrier family 13 (sodium-dependent dicarboxylate transporter), member 2/3/5